MGQPKRALALLKKREAALEEVHALLDGTYWSPTTLDDIAEVLRANGYEIRDPLQLDRARKKLKNTKARRS